jgi:hypothetical protein
VSLIVLPYTFVAGTTIASAQVNADFQSILNVVNGNLDSTNFSTIFSSLNLSTKGHATFPGGFIMQWGATQGVAFDNSATSTPTFDIAFPNNCFGVVTQVNENTQNNPAAVTSFPSGETTSGFNLNALGGQAGATGTIFWLAIGY